MHPEVPVAEKLQPGRILGLKGAITTSLLIMSPEEISVPHGHKAVPSHTLSRDTTFKIRLEVGANYFYDPEFSP